MKAQTSWQARALKGVLRLMRRRRIYDTVPGFYAGLAQVRKTGPALPGRTLIAATRISRTDTNGQPVYTLSPRQPSRAPRRVFYLHGGAHCRPITRHHWSFLGKLVATHGLTVVVPLLPLAPESKALQTLQRVTAIYAQCLAQQGPFDAVMGDSSGGGLSLALCQALRDAHQPLPGRMVLITPWVDVTLPHPDVPATAAHDPMLGVEGLREAGRIYAGTRGVSHPSVSPLNGDTQDLPPMLLLVASDDILCHDALNLVDKARSCGCQVEVKIGHGMVHAWPLLPLPEARSAQALMAEFLRR